MGSIFAGVGIVLSSVLFFQFLRKEEMKKKESLVLDISSQAFVSLTSGEGEGAFVAVLLPLIVGAFGAGLIYHGIFG